MNWSRVSIHDVIGLASRPTVGAIRSSQIVECSGHAQNRGPRVRTKQRKSIQNRHKNGKKKQKGCGGNRSKAQSWVHQYTSPYHMNKHHTHKKKRRKKVNISRNETKQIDSEWLSRQDRLAHAQKLRYKLDRNQVTAAYMKYTTVLWLECRYSNPSL
jgi:hypothetical protein